MYILTDTFQIACHGSFPSVEEAVFHARGLQTLGLCRTFNVGGYSDGKFQVVYEEPDPAPEVELKIESEYIHRQVKLLTQIGGEDDRLVGVFSMFYKAHDRFLDEVEAIAKELNLGAWSVTSKEGPEGEIVLQATTKGSPFATFKVTTHKVDEHEPAIVS